MVDDADLSVLRAALATPAPLDVERERVLAKMISEAVQALPGRQKVDREDVLDIISLALAARAYAEQEGGA